MEAKSSENFQVWHPYTQALTHSDQLEIEYAKGCYLFTADHQPYLDAISSWWVNTHGHCHPEIIGAITDCLPNLDQVIHAGFTHKPALALAHELYGILPGDMTRIFFTDTGATAVEVALKLAIQYFHNRDGSSKRRKVVSFKGGFHGETFGAMSASGRNAFNQPYWHHLFESYQVIPPTPGNEQESLHQLQRVLMQADVACFIYEPLILGAGGMLMYTAEALNPLLELARKQGVLLIADEIMTGFGRTTTLFASEQVPSQPDMICLGKSLSGGALPLAAMVCQQHIYEAFLSNDPHKAFLHGHSYYANPLACAAAVANIQLLNTDACYRQRNLIEKNHEQFCAKWSSHPNVRRCESLGTILAVEYAKGASTYDNPIGSKLATFFLNHGILVRPLGNVLYIMPPYCITSEELTRTYQHIAFTIESLS